MTLGPLGHGNEDPRDWPEDFSHENGNYFCVCYKCGHAFKGHKRRVCCKVCAKPTGDAEKDSITTGVRFMCEADFGEYE